MAYTGPLLLHHQVSPAINGKCRFAGTAMAEPIKVSHNKTDTLVLGSMLASFLFLLLMYYLKSELILQRKHDIFKFCKKYPSVRALRIKRSNYDPLTVFSRDTGYYRLLIEEWYYREKLMSSYFQIFSPQPSYCIIW